VICTENFTPEEVERLIFLLDKDLGLIATKQKRKTSFGNRFRIRLSGKQENLSLLRKLVQPYMHPLMHYKRGIF